MDFGHVQNDPSCGLSVSKRDIAQRRIVGGDEAGFGSFPWQAYIRIGREVLNSYNFSVLFWIWDSNGLFCSLEALESASN